MLSMEYVRSRPLRLPSSGRPPPARLRPSHAVLPPPTALVPEDEYGSARRDKKHYFGSRITSAKVACNNTGCFVCAYLGGNDTSVYRKPGTLKPILTTPFLTSGSQKCAVGNLPSGPQS